jgi:hypothetical protein
MARKLLGCLVMFVLSLVCLAVASLGACAACIGVVSVTEDERPALAAAAIVFIAICFAGSKLYHLFRKADRTDRPDA